MRAIDYNDDLVAMVRVRICMLSIQTTSTVHLNKELGGQPRDIAVFFEMHWNVRRRIITDVVIPDNIILVTTSPRKQRDDVVVCGLSERVHVWEVKHQGFLPLNDKHNT